MSGFWNISIRAGMVLAEWPEFKISFHQNLDRLLKDGSFYFYVCDNISGWVRKTVLSDVKLIFSKDWVTLGYESSEEENTQLPIIKILWTSIIEQK